MTTYQGSCHCGDVAFHFEGEEITNAVVCNCSRCHRLGMVLTFIPEETFTLEKGEGSLTNYQFNKKHINHLFCKNCGVQSFSKAHHNGKDIVAINLRTVDGVDIDSLEIQKVNGKDM